MDWREKFNEEFVYEDAHGREFIKPEASVNDIKNFISQTLKQQVEEIKKIIIESVKDTEKEHGSKNVYLDMVGEIACEQILKKYL